MDLVLVFDLFKRGEGIRPCFVALSCLSDSYGSAEKAYSRAAVPRMTKTDRAESANWRTNLLEYL
jgi:hypothetical protein